ncbi:alpha/beta hydrolase [Amycolatopsis magusensis]|uniref:Pimeloyl-ACP methyl ester carboxylesterase n=1 Tax=Amycolatopsis magusensis TaxID=882444 RepID=A0ABS4PUS4_9PSEU|nr:alpha/beta hydrolase [Amycolatopsis magusensis]MBP2183182.1 pimeloyl-ACP methyl ester carboxylesterase [Amycolatopsis magusensis]
MRRQVLAGAVVVTFAVAGLPATAGAAPARAPEPAAVGATAPINWTACPASTLVGVPPAQHQNFSCAYHRVPIDHDNAALGTIDISLLRRHARQPAAKIGSLFLNPGGPGGSGLRMPISADRFLEPELLDRFDVVGFDPRGVGGSNPLRCFTTAEDQAEVFAKQVSVPITRTEMSDSLAAYRDYAGFCDRNAGSLLDHMSTRDVVRDLDLLRAAAGDQKLTYIGFSYGTLIGATYANMFPKTTRALVLDGNVDPKLRTSNGLQYDRERARGFEISLGAFLAECKEVGPKCAFSSGDPRQKFDEIREHLRKQPIPLPAGGSLTIHQFTDGVGSALYNFSEFPELGENLQAVYEVLHPPAAKVVAAADLPTLTAPSTRNRYDVRPDTPYTADDSYFAVNCSDKAFKHKQAKLPEIAAQWEKESRTFGRSQAFADAAACPVWPGEKEPYTGPWNARTETPVLVVGNYYDPATQYEFSRRMADQLGNARLVSVDAHGHCILGDSQGVDDVAADYLVDLKVPPPGLVFQPDVAPFDPVLAAS